MNALRLLGWLRRRILLHRRALAAVIAAAAVLVGLRSLSPLPPPTQAVWTASRDLPSGTVLRDGDLRRAEVAPDSAPDALIRQRADALGRTLAAPMARGEVLTGMRLMTRGLLAGYPGRTAVPVRVTDAEVVGLLRVGDLLTLVVADPDGATAPATLVADVPVVAIPRGPSDSLSRGTPGRLVVVAVPDAAAREVAAGAVGGFLTAIWNR